MIFSTSKMGGIKMNKKFLACFLVATVMLCVLAVSALAVPVTISKVEIEDETVTTTDTNRLDLERGQDIEVKVNLNAVANGSDLEVHAFISGFEFNQDLRISDVTPVFDVESGVTYIKRLKLTVPDLAQEDNYLLRIMVTDRNTAELVQSYKLKLDVPRHTIAIRDVVVNPDSFIEAGRALLVTVRLKNMGERDEEGIRIKVSIPELGISATDYLDELKADESTSSEELYLRIPDCAKPGDYELRVVVDFNEGFDKVSTTKNIEVTTQSEACSQIGKQSMGTVSVSSYTADVEAGGAGGVFAISIYNTGSSSKVYTLSADGVDSWGSVRFSPSNVVIAQAGEVKTVNVFVTAKSDATSGEHPFSVVVKDQSGNVVDQVLLKANVVKGKSSQSVFGGDARKYLEIGLVLLVVVLIVLALIVIFTRMRGKEDEEEDANEEAKTYY